MAAACASSGYAAASIADIVSAAAVSRNTFYEFFDDKEACLLAAQEDYRRQLCAAIDGACAESEGRPQKVRAAVHAALAFFAADPAAAHLLAAAILSLGRAGAERYQAMIDELAARLHGGAVSPAQTCGPESSAIGLATSLVAVAGARGDTAAILAFENYFTALFLDPPTLAGPPARA
jgi:AcrR family transcriptional regulator